MTMLSFAPFGSSAFVVVRFVKPLRGALPCHYSLALPTGLAQV